MFFCNNIGAVSSGWANCSCLPYIFATYLCDKCIGFFGNGFSNFSNVVCAQFGIEKSHTCYHDANLNVNKKIKTHVVPYNLLAECNVFCKCSTSSTELYFNPKPSIQR